jgi:Fe-S-cluster-containing hydrogenase component 2
MVSRRIGNREITLAYLPAGRYFGELGLLGNRKRMDKVQATVRSEVIKINRDSFQQLLNQDPSLKQAVQKQLQRRLDEEIMLAADPDGGDTLAFFMQKGLGEGTDVLLIDESLCIGCDNCEKACAATHGGISRLKREAGPSFNQMHIPFSCRHCEQPHCMQDCPPDAIHRTPAGAVYIDDTCIGCGNCERNCPYDAIHMAYNPPYKPNLLGWLLTGIGKTPGEDSNINYHAAPDDVKKAYKCDSCMNVSGGPACVRACPTGAALRVKPEHYVQIVTNT